MEIRVKPEVARVLQGPENINNALPHCFDVVRNPMFLTQSTDQWGHPMVVVARHRGKQMMFDLKVEVPAEPVVEGGLLDITGGL